jgi:hypothetical protein
LIFFCTMYFIQHCFICRPSDSPVSGDSEIQPGPVATSALASDDQASRLHLIHQPQRITTQQTRFDPRFGPWLLYLNADLHPGSHTNADPDPSQTLKGQCGEIFDLRFFPVLWNRNYILRFRFRLLQSYGFGSGSDLWKVKVPVPIFDAMVPLPALHVYLDHKNLIKKFFSEKILPRKLFYKGKFDKFHQIYCKM